MSTFRVGIVGAGAVGQVHARELGVIEEAQVVAVADPNEEVGRKLAACHGVGWYPSLNDMLGQPDLDVVILCTPSGAHPEGTELAASAGKHVISEKPMAITLAGADRMIESCHRAGVYLSVIFQYRFTRDALRIKRALEAGLFGQPVMCNAIVHLQRDQRYYDENGGWRRSRALNGGGVLINPAIHAVDLLQWFMGPVESLYAYGDALTHDIEVEDATTAAVRFESGAMGTIQATTSAHQNYPLKIELRGTEGGATFERARLTEWDPRDNEAVLTKEEECLLPEAPDHAFGEPYGKAHSRQLREIFAALREGRQPPVSGEEARKAIEIVLDIYRSASEGSRVSIGEGIARTD